MSRYLTLDDLDLAGKAVLVRADLNVPLEDGEVGDDFRIRSALPTLQTLVDRGAQVTVCSHLGRPKGVDPAFSMRPVIERMSQLSDISVGDETSGAVIRVLENTRFLDGETSNDPTTAAHLAAGQDLFIQDAFGSVHRAHASTVGVAELLPSAAGPLLDAELASLGRLLEDPARPYVVILGGAKVSDKLGVIKNLLPKVDTMLIGGGMCFTFLKALGHPVGNSLVEEAMLDEVAGLLEAGGAKIVLPSDIVAADRFAEDADAETVTADAIPPGRMGLDIGPKTAASFADTITKAGSVFWNGPMGVFEWDNYRHGTETVARALGECEGFTAVGGGDSAAAMRALHLENTISHLSTGGGAGLELLEGRTLPGVAVLERWVK